MLASFVYDVILEGDAYGLKNTWFSKNKKYGMNRYLSL